MPETGLPSLWNRYRAAHPKDRINADRDAEILELFDDGDIENIVNQMINSLCAEHVALGPVLAEQWYVRRSFSPTGVEASRGT
jgi:hypothetical protein